MLSYSFPSVAAILLCGTGLGMARIYEHLETVGYTSALVSLFLFVLFNIFEPESSPMKIQDDSAKDAKLPSPDATFHLIKSRRSITPKDYNGGKVNKEIIDCILEAANWAPTHGKTEPWRFVVFSGAERINEYLDFIHDWYKKNKSEDKEVWNAFKLKYDGLKKSWPTKLSHLITIGMKRQANPEKLMPEWEETCAVACAFHNMHLMLTSHGLAGFWSSHTWCKCARDSKEFKEYLNLDEEDRSFGALVLGHVDDMSKFKSARGSIDQKVQWRGIEC